MKTRLLDLIIWLAISLWAWTIAYIAAESGGYVGGSVVVLVVTAALHQIANIEV
jgi:hypothetical protein